MKHEFRQQIHVLLEHFRNPSSNEVFQVFSLCHSCTDLWLAYQEMCIYTRVYCSCYNLNVVSPNNNKGRNSDLLINNYLLLLCQLVPFCVKLWSCEKFRIRRSRVKIPSGARISRHLHTPQTYANTSKEPRNQ